MTFTVTREYYGWYVFVTYMFSDGSVFYALENRSRFAGLRYFAQWR